MGNVMQDIAGIDTLAKIAIEDQLHGRPDHVPRLPLAERIHHIRQAQAARKAVEGT